MKRGLEPIEQAIALVALGGSLVAYAHANFATKSTVETMDKRLWEIHQVVVEKKEVPRGQEEDD
jgi:hypothetical protein